jgi:hypothetical protein
MSITPEFHVGITAPGVDGIYAVFSTRERAEDFIRDTLTADDSHDYKAVITDQSYTDTFEYDKREEIAWDTRHDDYADTSTDD